MNFYLTLKACNPKTRCVSQQPFLMAPCKKNESESAQSSNNGAVAHVTSGKQPPTGNRDKLWTEHFQKTTHRQKSKQPHQSRQTPEVGPWQMAVRGHRKEMAPPTVCSRTPLARNGWGGESRRGAALLLKVVATDGPRVRGGLQERSRPQEGRAPKLTQPPLTPHWPLGRPAENHREAEIALPQFQLLPTAKRP